MKKESQSNCFSPKMFVNLHCEHINRLILIVGNIETRQLLNIINSKVLKAGHHNVTVTLPSSGVYSIGLTVNGCVYKKKIYVK